MVPDDDEEDIVGTYEVTPRGSRVLLDGELLSTTPFDQTHRRGEWLELEIEGHRRQTQHHRLRLDRIGGFKIALDLPQEARETGRLSLDVQPAAAVYVDSRAFGAAPLDEVELPAGEQTVVFETIEGVRVRIPIEIEAGAHRKYSVEIVGNQADIELISP